MTDEDINPKRLFVHNLDFKLQQAEIRDRFAEFGYIIDCHLPQANGRPKGFALIEYDSEDAAKRALEELNESILGSRKIMITVSHTPLTPPVCPQATEWWPEGGAQGQPQGRYAQAGREAYAAQTQLR